MRKVSLGSLYESDLSILEPGFHWSLPVVGELHVLNITPTVDSLTFVRQLASGEELKVVVSYLFAPARTPVDMLDTLFSELEPQRTKWSEHVRMVLTQELSKLLSSYSFEAVADIVSSPRKRLLPAIDRATEVLARDGLSLHGVRFSSIDFVDSAVAQQYLDSRFAHDLTRLKAWGNTEQESQEDILEEEQALEFELSQMRRTAESQELEMVLEGKLYRENRIAQGDILVAEAQAEVAHQLSTLLFSGSTESLQGEVE
ncbi:MAG: hypothetical protein KDD55_04245 [Bdellovibrionales bacterium]|nr:hypothetical protein [Bdellovibrionales bacterium]